MGELAALLTKVTLPLAAPAASGVKVTVKDRLFPAEIVTGKLIPLSEYPWPFQAALATVTSEVPADKVPALLKLLPTATVPKLSVEGETPSSAGPRPVPVSGTLAGLVAPSTAMDKVPFTAPGVVGANVMVMDEDCPGARTIGSAGVEAVKPAPVVVTSEKVTFGPSAAEEFVRVSALLLLLPT